ncbi:ARM repeat-containing protein [Coprinopsis marcescibilis]|uniref:ARM repeat-containing protein n=1 Tax=Coprinopsis marcescibilis TaxID=230819 RepID=A0A5C3L273_COPMA|nr:ARM repeat-containing protein [Coprinopsis marcescibilis]
MGKSQKKRSMRRHNPVRVPDSHLPHGLAAASESSSKTGQVLPIIQKMESPDAGERKWACVAVSNIIQNDPSTRRLLQGKNVVGALITRLTDSEEEVVAEAMGALRNLCIDGGYDICAEMYNKNILTPLKTFVPKISNTLSQFLASPSTSPENAKKIVYEFADNVITTLWCLSETSNKALNAINDFNLTPFLMSFLLARESLHISPVISAAQCLYVLTDDNKPVIWEVRTDANYISCLLEIAKSEIPGNNGKQKESDPRAINLSVLAAGTLQNISPIPPPSVASTVELDKDVVLPVLQPVITSVSLLDISNNVQELVTRQASEPDMEKLSIKNGPQSDHKSEIEIQLEALEARLRTVQLSLEVLTGACATLPDPGPDDAADAEDAGNEDEMDGEDIAEPQVETDDMEMEAELTEAPTDAKSSLLPTLVFPLLALIQPTALSFPPLSAPSPHPPTTSALGGIHVSALECLNNIFLSLAMSKNEAVSKDVQNGASIWNSIWSGLELVGTQTGLGQERRQEFWEVAVGILWGVGLVWKGSIEPRDEQVKVLMQLCDATKDERLRVKCIGTLECLAQCPTAIEQNKVIAQYFISMLPTAAAPSPAGTEPMIQAASALIDIYSDETLPYDINFRQGNFNQTLAASLDGIKKAVKAVDRRKEGGKDLRQRGELVRENLAAFVQYRKSLKL